jgi:hypothetical protein
MSIIQGTVHSSSGPWSGFDSNEILTLNGSSNFLSRTVTTAGSTQKMTFSAWVKFVTISAAGDHTLFGQGDGTDDTMLVRQGAGTWWLIERNTYTYYKRSTAGPVAGTLYHIVMSIDYTQTLDTNRVKIFVDNVNITGPTGTGNTYPPANHTFYALNKTDSGINTFVIGRNPYGSSGYCHVELSDVHYIDGFVYSPSDFAQTVDSVYQPKTDFSGITNYGTNGFYLKFTNSSNIGDDSAGSNDLTLT